MTSKLLSAFILGISFASAAQAQLTLNNFSGFTSPRTLFYGDWSDTGDPFAGSTGTTPAFSQGFGCYNFGSATNADTSFVEHSFASSLNITSASQLSLSLRLLDGNTADSLTVFLFDTSARSAFATFLTSDFTAGAFSERSIDFTFAAGFAFDEVSLFRISGNDPFASGVLSVAIDNLAVNIPGTSAVPEPSTYGIIGAAALMLAALRKRIAASAPKIC